MPAYAGSSHRHPAPQRLLPPPRAYRDDEGGHPLVWTALGFAAAAGIGYLSQRNRQASRRTRPEDDAPLRSRIDNRRAGRTVTGRTVTIAKPKAELYAFFRDFSNLPQFMENLVRIEPAQGGDETRHRWVVTAPAGRTLGLLTEVTADHENELIGWRSVEGSDIETAGHIAFRDAPGERGTEVELVIAYKPPLGEAGRLAAKFLQNEPHLQARRDLRRFRMLMETGEIATSQPFPNA